MSPCATERLWRRLRLLYIEDQPCQSTPQALSGITVSGGTNYYMHISDPSPGTPLRFRVTTAQAGLRWIETAAPTSIQRAGRDRPKVAIFGTSFTHNTGSTARFLYSWALGFGERFGVEVFDCARSGAGYVSDGSNVISAQVAAFVATGVTSDLIIVEGSGNDISATGADIRTAAAAAFSSLADAFPGVPVLVFGAGAGAGARGSSGETGDVLAKCITYTQAAAEDAPNVLAFMDPVGTVTGMPTYTTGATYAAGDVVKVIGSAMRARVAIASAPATPTAPSGRICPTCMALATPAQPPATATATSP